MPVFHSSLADVDRELGRIEDARTALRSAFAFSEKNENRRWDAQLHRLDGELLVEQGAVGEGEHRLRRALEIARMQGANAYELAAPTSLARLLCDQQRCDEGRERRDTV